MTPFPRFYISQVQLDLRDLLYEKQTEGIKADLKYLIQHAGTLEHNQLPTAGVHQSA